jgi:hypothetical protein
MTKGIIEQWEDITMELALTFVKRYFDEDSEYWWVNEEVGSVLNVGDYFFDVNDMLDFMRYDYTKEQMFKFYNDRLEAGMNSHTFPNIKNYLKLK